MSGVDNRGIFPFPVPNMLTRHRTEGSGEDLQFDARTLKQANGISVVTFRGIFSPIFFQFWNKR